MRSLLDVNVLIALLDAAHVHHRQAVSWLQQEIRHGWASCPITQNGCIRILSHPAYPNPLPAAQVALRLREAVENPAHEFWPDDINLLSSPVFDWSSLVGHRQVTDIYLLALAVRHNGRLVTFDRRITLGAVKGASEKNLLILQ
ncbi:toxin-antitoxin system PIN domain toxin [Desulfacinum infernum DSM 9756]|uniref:Ribonuclease VapC n=1 Tax=Desulfacinum infernum DSM 9756 TaxID=1121391 RepID=A0A1M4Y0R7_9BACT|nr:TA system VapC family ribonuclease toxin [Desulfacinum infernum]SHE99417.1 toxin-antitoxin system PIN domain toxin [Desulfacinum infernum DSM 9756]